MFPFHILDEDRPGPIMQAINFDYHNDYCWPLAMMPTTGASNLQIACHSSQYVCDWDPLSGADYLGISPAWFHLVLTSHGYHRPMYQFNILLLDSYLYVFYKYATNVAILNECLTLKNDVVSNLWNVFLWSYMFFWILEIQYVLLFL